MIDLKKQEVILNCLLMNIYIHQENIILVKLLDEYLRTNIT